MVTADPRVRLDEIRQRANQAPEPPWYVEGEPGEPEVWVDHSGGEYSSCSGLVTNLPIWAGGAAEFIASARQDVPQLVAALEAVLDVHKPIRDSQEWCDADGLSWPCPTVRAITDALGGGQ